MTEKDTYKKLKDDGSDKMEAFHIANPESLARDGLKSVDIAAYSVGHVFNDMCASMWFLYFTWYISNVIGLSDRVTGLCVLSG